MNASETAAEQPVPRRVGSDSRAMVLVVDDSADVRAIVEDVLTSEGYAVRTAQSGPRALEMMSERRPDLILTDLLMPGMSGFSLRTVLMRRPDLAGIPVVVLSGYWQRPSETLDVAAVLTKPIQIDRLVRVVSEVVTSSRER